MHAFDVLTHLTAARRAGIDRGQTCHLPRIRAAA
jgi:hypothetical protein